MGTFLKPFVSAKNANQLASNKRPVIVDAPYGYTFRTNMDVTREFGPRSYRFRTNSLGFKDAQVRDVAPVSSNFRVLMIGDSFTDGVGVSYQDTMVGLLDASFPEFEFLNAAVQSYSPAIYLAKIKHLIEEKGLQFDEVVVFLDISDIEDEYQRSNFQMLKQFVRDHSLIVQFGFALKDSIFKALNPATVGHAMEEEVRGTEQDVLAIHAWKGMWTVDPKLMEKYGHKGIKSAKKNMDALHEYLKQRKIPMSLVVYPWPHQIILEDENSKQVKIWRAWAAENDVELINLFPPFFAYPGGIATVREYFIEGDVHWNEAGHRLVADQVKKYWSPLPLRKND